MAEKLSLLGGEGGSGMPKWVIFVAAGAGLFILLTSRKGEDEDTTEEIDLSDLISSQVNQRLFEFMELIQDQIGALNITPPGGNLPPLPPQIIGPPLQGPPLDPKPDPEPVWQPPPDPKPGDPMPKPPPLPPKPPVQPPPEK